MLKTTESSDKPVSSKNDDNKLVSKKINGNNEIDGSGGDSMEHIKKSKNWKGKNWLSPKNCLSQENPKTKNWKNCQKVGIYLILMLRKPDQAF